MPTLAMVYCYASMNIQEQREDLHEFSVWFNQISSSKEWKTRKTHCNKRLQYGMAWYTIYLFTASATAFNCVNSSSQRLDGTSECMNLSRTRRTSADSWYSAETGSATMCWGCPIPQNPSLKSLRFQMCPPKETPSDNMRITSMERSQFSTELPVSEDKLSERAYEGKRRQWS